MDQYDFIPWEKYPDLTNERLAFIASLIREVRDGVAKDHNPTLGDGPWGFGCRAYERTCFAFVRASEAQNWLTILPDRECPLRFTFAIGSVPFRFYHGSPSDPPSHYLETTYEEIRQWQMALDLEMVSEDAVLRIAVETGVDGRAKAVSVVEMNEFKNVTGSYLIPFDAQRGTVVPLRAKPVDTPAPVVEPIEEDQSAGSVKERNVSEG